MSKFWPNFAMLLMCHLSSEKNLGEQKLHLKITLYSYRIISRGHAFRNDFYWKIYLNVVALVIIISGMYHYEVTSKHELNWGKSGQ